MKNTKVRQGPARRPSVGIENNFLEPTKVTSEREAQRVFGELHRQVCIRKTYRADVASKRSASHCGKPDGGFITERNRTYGSLQPCRAICTC